MILDWNEYNERSNYNFDDPEFETENWPTLTIGDTVTIPKNLTTDTFNKKGETGKVFKIEGEIVYVKFKDGEVAPFDINIFSKG